MKKLFYLFTLLFFTGTSTFIAQQSSYSFKISDANNIHLQVNNVGGLNNPNGNAGGHWTQIKVDSTIVYDQGLWVIGKIGDEIYMGENQWQSSYSIGPIINSKPAMEIKPEDSLKYRVYKISKGDDNSNVDFLEWPGNFGAPLDENGNPKIYGDQSIYTVFNALGKPSFTYFSNFLDSLKPMPIEVRQLVYSRKGNSDDSEDIFSNVLFFEWTIINKGNSIIDSAYVSLWTDIDFLLNTNSNVPAVDTAKQVGYCWDVGTNVPAVGYALLYGPIVPSNGDNAVFKGKRIANFKNLGVTSFHAILDDAQIYPPGNPAYSVTEAWNIARGFETDGTDVTDPVTGLKTNYYYSGDPVDSTGWLGDRGTVGGGAGFNMFSGPFTLAPQDTQWVMMALVPALGNNGLKSIEIMRSKIAELKSLSYDSLAFGSTPIIASNKDNGSIINDFVLEQNYPNPFNPTTKIKYEIPNVVDSKFASSQYNVKLIVYDVLGKEVAVLVNKKQTAGNYEVNFNASKLTSGIYFYQLQVNTPGNVADHIKTMKMVLLK